MLLHSSWISERSAARFAATLPKTSRVLPAAGAGPPGRPCARPPRSATDQTFHTPLASMTVAARNRGPAPAADDYDEGNVRWTLRSPERHIPFRRIGRARRGSLPEV